MKSVSFIVALILASCSPTYNKTGVGMLYSDVIEAVAVGGDDVKPIKTGRACSQSILSLVATGDSSIDAAKRNGKITKVSTVNVENFSIIVFGRSCTIVTGE